MSRLSTTTTSTSTTSNEPLLIRESSDFKLLREFFANPNDSRFLSGRIKTLKEAINVLPEDLRKKIQGFCAETRLINQIPSTATRFRQHERAEKLKASALKSTNFHDSISAIALGARLFYEKKALAEYQSLLLSMTMQQQNEQTLLVCVNKILSEARKTIDVKNLVVHLYLSDLYVQINFEDEEISRTKIEAGKFKLLAAIPSAEGMAIIDAGLEIPDCNFQNLLDQYRIRYEKALKKYILDQKGTDQKNQYIKAVNEYHYLLKEVKKQQAHIISEFQGKIILPAQLSYEQHFFNLKRSQFLEISKRVSNFKNIVHSSQSEEASRIKLFIKLYESNFMALDLIDFQADKKNLESLKKDAEKSLIFESADLSCDDYAMTGIMEWSLQLAGIKISEMSDEHKEILSQWKFFHEDVRTIQSKYLDRDFALSALDKYLDEKNVAERLKYAAITYLRVEWYREKHGDLQLPSIFRKAFEKITSEYKRGLLREGFIDRFSTSLQIENKKNDEMTKELDAWENQFLIYINTFKQSCDEFHLYTISDLSLCMYRITQALNNFLKMMFEIESDKNFKKIAGREALISLLQSQQSELEITKNKIARAMLVHIECGFSTDVATRNTALLGSAHELSKKVNAMPPVVDTQIEGRSYKYVLPNSANRLDMLSEYRLRSPLAQSLPNMRSFLDKYSSQVNPLTIMMRQLTEASLDDATIAKINSTLKKLPIPLLYDSTKKLFLMGSSTPALENTPLRYTYEKKSSNFYHSDSYKRDGWFPHIINWHNARHEFIFNITPQLAELNIALMNFTHLVDVAASKNVEDFVNDKLLATCLMDSNVLTEQFEALKIFCDESRPNYRFGVSGMMHTKDLIDFYKQKILDQECFVNIKKEILANILKNKLLSDLRKRNNSAMQSALTSEQTKSLINQLRALSLEKATEFEEEAFGMSEHKAKMGDSRVVARIINPEMQALILRCKTYKSTQYKSKTDAVTKLGEFLEKNNVVAALVHITTPLKNSNDPLFKIGFFSRKSDVRRIYEAAKDEIDRNQMKVIR